MKILQSDGDTYIKAVDMIEAIEKHGELVKGNNAWSDKNLEEAYISAHKHICYMIEGELKAQKEVIDAGDNNNSDNLCNIGDDNIYQQREADEKMRELMAKKLFESEQFKNSLKAIANAIADSIDPIVEAMDDTIQQISKTE